VIHTACLAVFLSDPRAMSMKVTPIEPAQDIINNIMDPTTPTHISDAGAGPKVVRQERRPGSGLFDFANTEAIKEKVRQKGFQTEEAYKVEDYYHETGFFQWLATNPFFENTTLGVIVVNALWISHDTDGNNAETILDAKAYFIAADVCFFSYFSIELFVRFMAFKRKVSCCKDPWFVFDTSLVTLYAFDPFTLGIVAAATGTGLDLPTSVLRLLRLARLSRLVRMLRNLPELMIMIKGMVTASASVGYTLALLMIITYVFAIALVNLADPATESGETYFSTVPEAMHNLIIFGTFLDALSDFILAVKADSVPCFLISWIYIALASLTVMNMLIGVLCEVISGVAEEENEEMMVEKVKRKFGDIVQDLDKNNDGTLSWDEFQKILDHPSALDALESVKVDPESMVDLAEDFFFDNGDPHEVTFDQFMNLILDMRGGQQAEVKDIMLSGKRTKQRFMLLNEKVDGIEKTMSDISGKLEQALSPVMRRP